MPPESGGQIDMKLHVGTSGYSYKEWKGTFYPKGLAAADMLRYYGERFDTVEINNTFYQMPRAEVLSRWAAETPEGFIFVLKGSKRITHDQRLTAVNDLVARLLEVSATLGPKLGPLLMQLPPNFRKDVARLRAFLSLFPKGRRVALEFRHASWFDDETFGLLREHDAAFCIAEADGDLEVPFVATADWGYLRLRMPDYADRDLEHWSRRVQSAPWREAFVFFKHEDEGKGPQFASRFLEQSGTRKKGMP